MDENKYNDLFNMDKPMDKSMLPPPTLNEVISGLIKLSAECPLFYTNARLRMYVSAGIAYANQEMAQHKNRGTVPPIGLGEAGFMMMLSDIMSITYAQYAGMDERKAFPHNREEHTNNIISEFGHPDDYDS